jgi:hypothetical protein
VLAFGVVVPGLRPSVDEEIEEQGVVVVADSPPVADLLEQRGEVDLQIVAPAVLKLHEEVRRVLDGAAAGRVDVRLIRKNGRDSGSEVRPQRLLVSAHGDVDEFLGDAGEEKIHVGISSVPGTHRVLGEAEAIEVLPRTFGTRRLDPPRHILEAAARAVEEDLAGTFFLDRETLALIEGFGHFRGHVSAGETAGVGVLVVEPDFHA